jgi:hypothetical protein
MAQKTLSQKTKLLLGLILIIDLLYMVYLPIVFQKGGVEQGQLQGLFVLILGNVFIYSFRLNIKRIWERMLLVLLVTICSLGASFSISFVCIEVVYGDATWHLWGNPQLFFANLFMFAAIFLVNQMLTEVYAWMKKKLV